MSKPADSSAHNDWQCTLHEGGKRLHFFLLAEMAEAEVKWKSTALLVIDMQKDFILPCAPTHMKGGAAIMPNVIKAVEVARGRGTPVIWIVREHDPLGRDVELFRRPPYAADKPKPASKGSVGVELVDGLVIRDGDYKLVKTRFSAFFNTHLHSYLQGAGISKLVVTANLLDMKNIGVATPTLDEWCRSDY